MVRKVERLKKNIIIILLITTVIGGSIVTILTSSFWQTVTWEGTVKNEWGSGVHSAKVVLKYNGIKQKTVYTNSNGYYSISCSYYGSQGYTLTFSKEDYTSSSSCVPAIPGETITVNKNISYVERWAIIVGIENYKNPEFDEARHSDNDAKDWSAFLTKTDGLNFEHVSLYGDNTYSADGLAKESVVKQTLIDTISQTDAGDIFCFIFAGHGNVTDNNNYYLSMWDDSIGEDGEDGRLYDYELKDILEDCEAQRIFLFFDCCHAGGFASELLDMPNHNHIFFGAGAMHDGHAWYDKKDGNGCFTQCFLNEAWKENFSGAPNTIFNKQNSDNDLVGLTREHYYEHSINKDKYYSNTMNDWPKFYDWYTDYRGYFCLTKDYILDPE